MELSGFKRPGLRSSRDGHSAGGDPFQIVIAAARGSTEFVAIHAPFKRRKLVAVRPRGSEFEIAILERAFDFELVQRAGKLLSLHLEFQLGGVNFLAEADDRDSPRPVDIGGRKGES